MQTNLTQIDDSCRRNCWGKKKKNFQNFAIFAEILFCFFPPFFPQTECLINSSGGPPVGDNNAGGSDLEHVSVRCCCCCCWYLLGCPLPRNPIIVFILHLLKKPRIYFRRFLYTSTHGMDRLRRYILAMMSCRKGLKTLSTRSFELILCNKEGKKDTDVTCK